MKKTYYSPAIEETICQGLNAICVGSDEGTQPGGGQGHFGGAPRHL